MGISISGSNAISGLGGSDTNFDKVLEQLKEIESTNINRLEAWKSDWKLRYEAFTQIIEQIQAASSMLSQLSDKNSFVSKLVQSSNENIITAVANASAQDVQHTIKVSQVASNAIWANAHVFDSKTDSINTSGSTQKFSFTYAGKRHDFDVPANTTLESFASMINNSSENPGIKISIVKAGKGYVFQVAGKDTGEKNDLIIHDSNLVGMDAASSTSTWLTNNPVTPGDKYTNPTSYIFEMETTSGLKKSITVRGDETAQQLADKITNAFGSGVVTATIDPNTGDLKIDGLKSFTRRKASDEAYKPAQTSLKIPGASNQTGSKKLNEAGGIADGFADDDILTFTLTMEDGTSRDVTIKAGATNEELINALGTMTTTIDGGGAKFALNKDGSWSMDMTGVTGITVSATDSAGASKTAPTLDATTTAATGTKSSQLGGSIASSTLALSVDKDTLAKRLDGKNPGDPAGEDFTFTLVDKDGEATNITLSGDKTYQDLLDEIQNISGITASLTTDADGNAKLELAGFKSITQTGGLASVNGFTSKLTASMGIPAVNGGDAANSLFYGSGTDYANYTLEKAPDLVYTITTNDGKTGTLTLPSGSQFRDVMAALKNPGGSGWEWKDKDGQPTSAPKLSTKFTDADGKEYVDAAGNPLLVKDIDGPIYVQMDNVQSASGPGLAGQVATSSHWNIQRSTNSKYQVDNWPIEMESETNSISDAIEGVVFQIQDVGDARISVSTDITSVEQSIQNFLDAVNSVLLTVNDLMKYDETKDVTSNDPDDKGNENYSPSGLTNQKGNLLTGNYGVQLFKSRFSSVLTTSPPGFKSRQSADDILSGDLLASLANLGIKTDTDATSDTYGLLVLAPSSSIAALQSMDKDNYNDMITNHLEDVVNFFCASGIGSSSSTDFRYSSHVEGITKGGNYEVKYDVVNGEITNVTIDGYAAKRDESMPGYYFSVTEGDARGLAINIDNLAEGSHSGTISVKEGLVQTVNSFLKAELVFNDVNIPANATESQIADAIHLKSQNGALMSLRDNYMSVMESIDAKIEREQRRLDTWYNRQKNIFANLETMLKQYEQQQQSLEQQLKQLSGNS